MSIIIILPPDWRFWLTLETVKLREAILLSLDFDPRDVEYDLIAHDSMEPILADFNDYTAPRLSEHAAEYNWRLRQAVRGFNLSCGEDMAPLADFVAKSLAWGWSLPPELAKQSGGTPAASGASNAPSRLLRIGDVEELVGRKRSSIYSKIKIGRFPAQIKIDGAARWRSEDVDAWIKAQGKKS